MGVHFATAYLHPTFANKYASSHQAQDSYYYTNSSCNVDSDANLDAHRDAEMEHL